MSIELTKEKSEEIAPFIAAVVKSVDECLLGIGDTEYLEAVCEGMANDVHHKMSMSVLNPNYIMSGQDEIDTAQVRFLNSLTEVIKARKEVIKAMTESQVKKGQQSVMNELFGL